MPDRRARIIRASFAQRNRFLALQGAAAGFGEERRCSAQDAARAAAGADARDGAEAARAVGVADRAGEGVGGVEAGAGVEGEEALHHVLDLLLVRLAVADHRLLDLQRGVFGHRQVAGHRAADHRAARLAEQQGGLRVDVDEDLLDRDHVGAVGIDDLAHAVEQGLEAAGELAVLRPDAAAGDIAQLVAELVHQAEAGDAQPGVEAEDAGDDVRARGSAQIFTAVPLTHTISMPLSAPRTS